MTCECCKTPALSAGPVKFVCTCADELFCRKCNHCQKHCKCGVAAEWDVPLSEQLSIAKYELRRMGVAA